MLVYVVFYFLASLLVTLLGTLVYIRISQSPKSNYDKINEKAIKAYCKGNYKKAITLFNKVLEANPDLPETYYNIGLAYLAINDSEQAEANFAKAATFNSPDADTYYNLGILLLNKGNYSKAGENFKKALSLRSDDADIYYNYAITLLMDDHPIYDEAVENLNKAIELIPDKAEYRYTLAQTYDRKSDSSGMTRDIDAAIDAYQHVVAMKSKMEESNYRLAICFAKKGMWEESVDYCKKVIAINDKSAEAQNQLGLAFYCRGDIDEAVLMYKKAMDIAPGYAMAYKNLGFAYEKQGNFEDAIPVFAKFTELSDDKLEVDDIKQHIRELKESVSLKDSV